MIELACVVKGEVEAPCYVLPAHIALVVKQLGAMDEPGVPYRIPLAVVPCVVVPSIVEACAALAFVAQSAADAHVG
jgi:hypothetical protein